MKNKAFITLLPLFFSFSQSFCWGFKAHKHINKKSILFFDSELLLFYKSNYGFYVEHSVDPDKRRKLIKGEEKNHYINLDVYESYPFKNFPRKYKNAVDKYGKETLNENGVLPWNIEKVVARLIKAFKNKEGDRILKLSSDLGHYVGDAAVPLHITKNYDGQYTCQTGIHALWETHSIDMMDLDTISFAVRKIKYLENINLEIWSLILKSYSYVDTILYLEKKISKLFLDEDKYKVSINKRRVKKGYSKEFITEFIKLNEVYIRDRMYEASYLLSCLIYTAWIDSGQPYLQDVKFKKSKAL